MKKVIAIVLLAVLTLGTYVPAVMADGTAPETFYNAQDCVYVLKEDGTAEITGYTGSTKDLTIPSELDGHTVTSIRSRAFYRNSQLNSIAVPETIQKIGYGCFEWCSNLRTVTFAEGLKSIGNSPFWYCEKLNSVNIPDSLTEVVGEGLFAGCGKLQKVDISADHPVLTFVDGVLFNKVDSVLLWYPASRQGKEYQVPEGTKRIGCEAFNDAKAAKIILPASVEEIGSSAFSSYSLKTVNIPPKVTSAEGIFFNCKYLESVNVDEGNEVYASTDGVLFDMTTHTLVRYPAAKKDKTYTVPDGIEAIAVNSFEYAVFSELVLPSSVKAIGSNAFLSCEKLKELQLPEGLEELGSYAFQYCESLAKITLPNSLAKIDSKPFLHCKKLKEIMVSEDNPYLAMMNGFLVQKEDMALLSCPPGAKLQKAEVPSGVRRIAAGAFADCANLQEATFAEGLEKIDSDAFQGCTKLKRVVLPASLTEISRSAFELSRLKGTVFVVVAGSYAEEFCTANGLKTQYTE